MTADGIPLGLLHQQYHTRETPSNQKITKDQKKYRPIEEKEIYQWLTTMEESRKGITEGVTLIHVCDREGDLYELFVMAQKKEEIFLVRMVQNRLTVDNKKIMASLEQESPKGELLVNMARNTKENIPSRKVLMNSLKIREWTYPVCHSRHDRDINASHNILTEGLRIHDLA